MDKGLPFDLPLHDVIIPARCPVLGIELRLGEGRTANSPSLDRIEPVLGYVSGNVRVISDKANRLKGRRALEDLLARAQNATGWERAEFLMIAEYVRREMLLKEVRLRARAGHGAKHWSKIEHFLEKIFSRGQLVDVEEPVVNEVVGSTIFDFMLSKNVDVPKRNTVK